MGMVLLYVLKEAEVGKTMDRAAKRTLEKWWKVNTPPDELKEMIFNELKNLKPDNWGIDKAVI